MNRLSLVVLGALVVLGSVGKAKANDFPFGPTVIYGDDNRLDLYQVTNRMHLQLADSTVALVKDTDAVDAADGSTKLSGNTFGDEFNLCSDEPFREQTSAAFCSGFLVGPDTVVTAGHCISGPGDCASTKFVFGFALPTSTSVATVVKTAEVYKCSQVIHTESNNDGADFAIVKLDRQVLNHRTLDLRQSGDIAVGQAVVVIGYPSGIPVKVAAGANVRKLGTGFFVANTDTYGGNSGSAVFNDTDGKVEGVLVRGENDFVYRNGCMVSNRCPSDGCRGEDITNITSVLPFLKSN